MKQLRMVAAEIAEIIASIEKNPFVRDMEPRLEDAMLGSVGVYSSRTRKNVEYRCTVRNDLSEGPQGMCSCRGWAQSKRSKGPSKPCIHIVDNLLRQKWFDIGAVVSKEAIDAASAKTDSGLEEKKKKAKAALAAAEPAVKRKESTTAVAELPPEDEMHFGASSTPLLVACPASYISPAEQTKIVKTMGQPAALGTVIHTAAEMIVGEGLTTPPDMSEDLEDLGVTDQALLDDVPGLLWSVINEWHGSERDKRDPLKSYFQTVDLEQRFSIEMNPQNPRTKERKKITVTAILDFNGQSAVEGHWLIGDWKTNRKEDDAFYAEQMRMEAAALLMNDKTVDKVTVVLVWLRHGSRTVRTYTREEIRSWLKVLVKRTFFWDGRTYVTGDHCLYCPRTFTCEGRKIQLRNYIDIMGDVDTDMLLYDEAGTLLAADEMQRRLMVCKSFRKIDEGYVKALKILLSEGGAQPLVDQPGFELGLKEKKGQLKIDVADGWPIFMQYVTAEQISPALGISKTKLEAVVKGAMKDCETCNGTGFTDEAELMKCVVCDGDGEVEVYGRGQKGKVIKELMGKLEDGGVAKRGNPSHEVVVQKIKEEEADGKESGNIS